MIDKIRAIIIDQRDIRSKQDQWLAFLLLILIFFLPLLPAAFGQGYEQIKVLFFLVLSTFIGVGWILSSIKNPGRFKVKNSQIQLGLLVVMGTFILTSAFGNNFRISLLGNPPYFQGIIVYLYCYLWFLIVSTVPLKNSVIYFTWIGSALLVSCIALFQWILLHVFQVTIPTYAGRVVSTFGQPSLYSGLILFTLPILVSINKKTASLRKKYVGIAFIVMIFGIIVSESRAALILAGGLLFLWIWENFRQPIIRYGMVSGILVVMLLGLVSTYRGDGILNQEIIKPLFGTRVGEEGQERRVYIWLFIVDLIQKRPFLGYGLDNLVQVFPSAMQEVNPKPAFYFTVKDLTVDRAHNYLLDLLISGGLLVFFAWIAWYFLLVAKAKARWQMLFLGLFFIYIQFQILSIVHLVFLYTVAGLINRYDHKINKI